MFRWFLALTFSALLSPGVLGDDKGLGNSKLKEMGYERLEGKNRFKVGCHHIIRGADRDRIYHPTALGTEEIGLSHQGKWVSVNRSDKTRLLGAGDAVTVWRNCRRI